MDQNIKNIVFDLGGVLIDLNFERALKAFKKAGFSNIEEQLQSFNREGIFMQYELGNISSEEFRSAIREKASVALTDCEIDDMWNLILVGIPHEKLKLILELRSKYMVYLLSNTNSIHFKVVEEIFKKDHPEDTFLGLFDRVFLSHEMGLRKPDKKIYEKVIEEIGAAPETCIFFDDLQENLNAAKEVGLHTYLIDHPKALVEYFSHVQ